MNIQTKLSLAIVLLVAAAVVLQLSGCSLIGFGVGSIIDASKSDSLLIPGWRIETIKPGEGIRVLLKNGEEVRGTYMGHNPIPQEKYAARYADFQRSKQEELSIPALGDSITITLESGTQGKRLLLGFDHQYLSGKLKQEADSALGLSSYIISVKHMHDTTSGMVFLHRVDKIVDSRGNEVKGKILQRLAYQREIPLLSSLAVKQQIKTVHIPMEEVYQIEVPKKGNLKWTGLAIGAAVDVLVIIILAVSDSQEERPPPEPDTTTYSCPFVYSFDGHKYVLDSEPYGNAIYKTAQRTDWDNLDHLTEVQGIYYFKVTNELQETQYLDEMKLLVVDHPPGTDVMPSSSDQLHTLSATQPPIKAEDFRGIDVLELVKSKDDQLWISNPFGRDPGNKADGRDGIILEFARPEHGNFVKLAFNLQNTPWASFMQGQILELHGSKLAEWYDLLNTSPEASKAFQEVLIREGMLLIKLWNGKGWQDCDFIWGVGSALSKDQAVLLDLGDIPGEILRVRLESTVGLWMINSVQADYTPDLPLNIKELSPVRAVDYSGMDIRQLLNAIDGHYYEMPTVGDWAELSFNAPPKERELERSFVLKCTGHYIIHTSAKGEPQRDLIAKLISEPGAYGQYTLRLLSGYVTSALEQLE